VLEEYNKILHEAMVYGQKDRETKKQFILRLKEKKTTIFEITQRDKHELASTIWHELPDEFDISEQYFYRLFTEDEKLGGTNFFTNLGELHKHDFVNDECVCGIFIHNGTLYAPLKEEKEEKTHEPKTPNHIDDVSEYLYRCAVSLNTLGSLFMSLKDKYIEDPDITELVKTTLEEKITMLLKQTKEENARILALDSKMDLRQRVGKYQKLKAELMLQEFNIAKVAKELTPPCIKCGHSGITPKHMSFNIMKRELPDIHKKLEFFRAITIRITPQIRRQLDKQDWFVFDVADWFNRQIERQKLDLPFEEIVLENAKLK